MECLVCGNQNKKEFGNYFSLNNLWQCRKCGFVFAADFGKFNEEDYQRKEDYSYRLTGKKQESRLRNCRGRLKAIKNIIKPGISILDIGCHEGLFLKIAQEKGAQVFGLEPNYEMVKHAQNLSLLVSRGLIENFKTERRFDVITLFHVLEHIRDPKKIIKKIYFLLKPEGYLILELPDIESYLAKKLKENWPIINSEHLFYFSPKTLKIFLAKNNFSIEKLFKRQFDEWRLGIKESLVRLGLFKPSEKINGFFSVSKELELGQARNLGLRRIILISPRFLLSLLVKIFQRGDYILVIAKKNN